MVCIYAFVTALFAGIGVFGELPDASSARVLYDSGKFFDEALYPVGALQAVTHGNARWTPASGSAAPAEIVEIENDAHSKVLRRRQSADQPADADYLDFPPVAAVALTISFDARVSTADSRTLDMFLLREGETQPAAQASCLLWGHEPGFLSYYDGDYHRLTPIDTDWHHYEIVHNLRANTFDVRVDGATVGSALGWRNEFSAETPFGRLRIGSIRGQAGDYGDIGNLRISSAPAPPAISILKPLAKGGLVSPDEGFRFQIRNDHRSDSPAVELIINGEDVSDRLVRTDTPDGVTWAFHELSPDTAYKAAVSAANASGTTTYDTTFYTYTNTVDGYRGIWFTLGQLSGEYGDKYSAGSAFAWSHTLTPMAVYAAEVDKTYFVYAGVTGAEERYLLTMASYYDHAKHRVPRPTIVRDQRGVDDPHDNASIALDEDGYVWVFVAGRGRRRPGQIFRATTPFSVADFEQIASREQTYSQIWPVPGKGFFHLLTKYTRGRELYWETSADGRDWSEQRKLAGFGGHYQVSRLHGNTVGTAFNYHPDGNVDRRTNLYYMETADWGRTWTTVDNRPLEPPLEEVANAALIRDYEAQGKNVYIQKLVMNEAGDPAILYLTSCGHEPGPANDPRTWRIVRWDGCDWITSSITESDHNYDAGSFYIEEDRWFVMAPALAGPQPYHTGGEVGLWVSTNEGADWNLERRVTHNSPFNHSYVRRPHKSADPFRFFWADGDSSAFSRSRLYFANADGRKLYTLPYTMDTQFAAPIQLDPPVPAQP